MIFGYTFTIARKVLRPEALNSMVEDLLMCFWKSEPSLVGAEILLHRAGCSALQDPDPQSR